MLVVMIAALMIIISVVNPVFWRLDNLMDILKSGTVLGILACGMLLVVLTGGIDVSVGAVTAACACIVGTFLIETTSNIPLAFLVGVACGAGMGIGNGLLISLLRLPPIVATLGTFNIINGLVKYITNGTWLTGIPDNFISFGQTSFFQTNVEGVKTLVGLPVQVVFLAAVIAFTWWLLKYTRFGRSVYAIGGNRESAQRLGYNVAKSQILLYMYLGVLAGVASVVHTSIYRQVDPNSFAGWDIKVIGATVIGGTNINGGYGSVLGAMLGVFFMTILQNGLILMRIPTFWQQIVTGIVIIAAVSVDAYSRYRTEKNRLKVDVAEAV
jgi:ribose/xylose/arabinose/galactoside ABC-type transport system permease subunit